MRVATDVGGTFTDVVCFVPDASGDGVSEIRVSKSDTTPAHFEDGVMDVLAKIDIDLARLRFFVHGTTIVINALTERNGPKTALITTKGFRDVLEIARGNRPDLFNFRYRKPPPLIPRYLRKEVTERTEYTGRVLTPVNLEELRSLAEELKREGVAAVGICFLHSYRNPQNEQHAAAALRELLPEVSIITSSEITREWREYERTNTVAAAALVQRTVETYLDSLERRLRRQGYSHTTYVMRSNGGVDTLAAAKARGITMVESGPAGGIFGAAALGNLIGEPNLIALDIGGTTAKCSLIENGKVRVINKYSLDQTRRSAGYPLLVPVIDIVEIGNGGGSIAWLDDAGKLRVGPKSAGAQPGPAAYGRGGFEFTTTDAHLLSGRIDPEYFLGGQIRADIAAARAAAERLGKKLGATVEDVARGVLRIADTNMVNALKLISLNRGYDPRRFQLIAFGGGGGLHATSLARRLNIPVAIVPVNCSVFSAWGMLLSDLRRDYVVSEPLSLNAGSMDHLRATIARIERQAVEDLKRDRIDVEGVTFDRLLDMRYEGQEHTVKVTCPTHDEALGHVDELLDTFRTTYEREFSYRLPNAVEVVNVHLVAQLPVSKLLPKRLRATGRHLLSCIKGKRAVDFDELGIQTATVYDRALLEPGMKIAAPAIIEEPDTTIVVDSGFAQIDDFGNIRIYV